MNTRNDTPTRVRISEDEVQPQVKKPQRKKADPKALRILRFGMLASGAIIVVLALVMILLPMFKVNKIVVEGNNYYDDETVAKMAGIAIGDELFGWNMQSACDAIMAKYPYANDIYISISFPFTVKITIVEKPNLMHAELQNQYFSFDRTLRVLEIKTDGEEAFSPFLRVKLPQISGVQIGYPIQFADSRTDISYLTELLDVLSARNILQNVTYVDVSEQFSLSFVLSNSIRVEIGGLQDMDTKLALLEQELSRDPLKHNIYEVIDVSNTSKTIRKQIEAKNLFD
jgi:hypothetical protein